jgi:hypothetical protein
MTYEIGGAAQGTVPTGYECGRSGYGLIPTKGQGLTGRSDWRSHWTTRIAIYWRRTPSARFQQERFATARAFHV